MKREIDRQTSQQKFDIRMNREKASAIRSRFETIHSDFLIAKDYWTDMQACRAEGNQKLAMHELASILRDEIPSGNKIFTDSRVAFHDLRGKVAIIMNAILLLPMVEDLQDRMYMVDMVKRNLESLKNTVDHICSDIEHGAAQERLITLLFDASDKLKKVLAY